MKKRKIVAITVTVVLLAFIFHKLNWSELIQTFKTFNFKNLFGIVVFYVLGLYLRGVRWKALLMNDPKYSALHLGEVFTVGSMLNIFLPARAGDVYRAYYLGKVKNEKKMKVFGSIILERTLDGISVFLILLGAVLLYCKQEWILNITYGIGALFVGSMVAFYLIFKYNKINFICEKLAEVCKIFPEKFSTVAEKLFTKIGEHANSFMEGFEVLDSFKYSMIAVISSIVVWGLECYVVYLILGSFNLGLGFASSLFVISLISFSTMIPSTSVFLGPYQYAYILALGIFGVEKSTTLAISTVHQGILMVILTIIGVYYLLKFNISIKDIETEEIAEQKV